MFDQSRLKDPGYFRENRLDPHTDHAWYACEEDMQAENNSLRMSLNGIWKFFHAVNPGQVIEGFEQPAYDCRGWEEIRVPAHIQREGYGTPQYTNTQYPWTGHETLKPGEIPERFNPVACYVKHFTLPEQMRGKRVFISFQGAESCVAVWLNGKYIGFSSDSFTPHEFELTEALTEGENKLACRVYRFCAGSWLEDQDFLRFSGLYREVFLYAVPEAHVWDLQIQAEPDAEMKKGVLRWKARISAPADTAYTLTLSREGETRGEETGRTGGETEIAGCLEIPGARLWSAEDPYLYDLTLRLITPGGNTEIVPVKTGFRKIEIVNSVIRVNGVRVVFKGVNRHDFCGETGRAVTEEKIRRDLILMKRNNINAVRTSHYPNSSALYRLCDELGLYVIDENNMESHGMWDMLMERPDRRGGNVPGEPAGVAAAAAGPDPLHGGTGPEPSQHPDLVLREREPDGAGDPGHEPGTEKAGSHPAGALRGGPPGGLDGVSGKADSGDYGHRVGNVHAGGEGAGVPEGAPGEALHPVRIHPLHGQFQRRNAQVYGAGL